MENATFEKERTVGVYENCQAPDVIIRQPITTQPTVKPQLGKPITSKSFDHMGCEIHKTAGSGTNHVTGGGVSNDKVYSVDAEQTNRDWSTDLFYSIRGQSHKKSFKDNARRAIRDCACVPCMMCSIAERLGDPRYLPFVPCTGPAVRFKVRILGGITGSICKDCVVTSFCWPCAVCQMHREMDDIGI